MLAPFPALPIIQLLIASLSVLKLDNGMVWEQGITMLPRLIVASLCNALSSIGSHSKGSDEEEDGEKKKVPKPGDIVNLVSHCTQTNLTV